METRSALPCGPLTDTRTAGIRHRYMGSADDSDFMDDETGWKLIHGDVFRFPNQKVSGAVQMPPPDQRHTVHLR